MLRGARWPSTASAVGAGCWSRLLGPSSLGFHPPAGDTGQRVISYSQESKNGTAKPL